jgi:enamine deaminase RidA (YjgF/YER057c/UK114 family)
MLDRRMALRQDANASGSAAVIGARWVLVGTAPRGILQMWVSVRVTAWLMVNGFVNAEPGYPQTTAVMNPLSDLIVDLYGPEVGSHARTAIGVAAVPLNLPVVVAAEVEIS